MEIHVEFVLLRRQRKKSGLKDRKKKNAKSLPASLASSSQRLSDGSQTQSFFQVLQHDKSTEGSQRFKLRSKPTLKSVLSNQTSYKLSNPRFGPESGLFLYLDLHGHTTKRGTRQDLISLQCLVLFCFYHQNYITDSLMSFFCLDL